MKAYEAIFFWLGGVLTPTLPELTMVELTPGSKGHECVHTRDRLRVLAEDAALGKLDGASYCSGALGICHAAMTPTSLEEKLIAAASLRQPLAQLIREIPSRYERWLVVDYPQTWFESLADRAEIEELFESNVIFTAQLELVSMVPDVFYRLPQKAARPMQDCIIIDGESRRAVQSMRQGLTSVFYTYVQRLKLELALQELWQTQSDIMHPTSSERVKL